MQINRKILRINREYRPFISSYLDIDKENISYRIGDSQYMEDNVFDTTNTGIPMYIKLLCELKPVKNFNKMATVTSKYIPLTSSKAASTMSYKPYNDITSHFVSAIDVNFKDIIPDAEFDSSWTGILAGKTIHTKRFKTQDTDMNIVMENDDRYEVNKYNHYISKAFPYAGYYHKGISLPEIEQYFFYIGTELQSEKYMKTLSTRDLFKTSYPCITTGLKMSDITSLEDDIVSGKIEVSFPRIASDSEEAQYQSIRIQKKTVVSDRCIITFRRKKNDDV